MAIKLPTLLRQFAICATAVVAFLQGVPLRAQTIDELVGRGQINIGCLIDAPPYGLLNAQQQAEGYDIDVANLIGKAMGVKVNIVPVTGPARIPYLLTGKIDVVVATMGITPDRARQVMFSVPTEQFRPTSWLQGSAGLKARTT